MSRWRRAAHTTIHNTIETRYAAKRTKGQRIFPAIGIFCFALLGIWLVWVIKFYANPEVTSQLISWEIETDHVVAAVVDVHLDQRAVNERCVIRAYAKDHTIVGDAPFVPTDGANTVRFRVERRATSVESIGCTSDSQGLPR